ncbi:phosphate/phosphite/phosphonate ABC transporter substrate-binding protein [Salisediminibacterium selenitireducens]|uniref:Phosphonate ABC transporter, periplasmic phosphonate-binding protein n=1 Tax=Bacillus selenitireducens (strain ATCC 700615 / DSM 15326 / MLS10) TaxID=439292 RepID=D6XXQ3_BACIE|nr:phosphate/phosphite/phosphonate ABC transporter substrate-binding protein [Salisediminibacterium selenitireducens]ADI00096.1 phosphonate ABC transporter, periplasmic phosphonate-binding protein [[Bacillus] selenitireducens MLS10]
MKRWMTTVAAMGLLTVAGCQAANEDNGNETADGDPEELVLGFFPSTDSDQVTTRIEPMADQLSEALGMPVRGEVMTNYSALVEAMGSGQVHVGFIPAFAYILANERHDIEVILKSLRDGEDSYRSQFVVRADADYETVADLEGAIWAFPDVASTSGYLFPATQIRNELGMSEDAFFGDLLEAGTHDNALVSVMDGNADVATTFEDARVRIEDDYPDVYDEENGLRQLSFTDPIPNDTISVIPELSAELVAAIEKAFLSFNDDDDILAIMEEVYRWDGITEASDEEYDIIRQTYENFSDEIDPLE